MEVIPLKYGVVFKRVFGNPAVFQQFAQDVLGIELSIQQVHTEYEYPEPVGFVRSQYDLFADDPAHRVIVEIQHIKEEDFYDRFLYYHLISLVEQVRSSDEYGFARTVYTIVVLTSVPRNKSVNFSCAVSNFSPVDERGQVVNIYPHRLVFLVPRLVNESTPPAIAKWLDFIADSLDGEVNESHYPDALFQGMLVAIRRQTISPDELAKIKDEAAWELAKRRFAEEGREDGRALGRLEGRLEGREEGRLEGQKALIKAMLANGMSIEQVAAVSGLSVAEVSQL